MNFRLIVVIGAVLSILAIGLSQPGAHRGPAFTKNGKLVLPTGFREWVFVEGPITPTGLHGLDVMVKDSKRFGTTNNWGFFTFGHHAPPYEPAANVMSSTECAYCHVAGVAKTGHGLGAILSFTKRRTAVNIGSVCPPRNKTTRQR